MVKYEKDMCMGDKAKKKLGDILNGRDKDSATGIYDEEDGSYTVFDYTGDDEIDIENFPDIEKAKEYIKNKKEGFMLQKYKKESDGEFLWTQSFIEKFDEIEEKVSSLQEGVYFIGFDFYESPAGGEIVFQLTTNDSEISDGVINYFNDLVSGEGITIIASSVENDGIHIKFDLSSVNNNDNEQKEFGGEEDIYGEEKNKLTSTDFAEDSFNEGFPGKEEKLNRKLKKGLKIREGKVSEDIYGLRDWVILYEEDSLDKRFVLAEEVRDTILNDLVEDEYGLYEMGIDHGEDEDGEVYYTYVNDDEGKHYKDVDDLIEDWGDDVIDFYKTFEYWDGSNVVFQIVDEDDSLIVEAFILPNYNKYVIFIPEYKEAYPCVKEIGSPFFYYDGDAEAFEYSYQVGDEDRSVDELLDRINRKN